VEGSTAPAKAAALLRGVHESAAKRAELVAEREALLAAGDGAAAVAEIDQEIGGHDSFRGYVLQQLEVLRMSYGAAEKSWADVLTGQGWREVSWVPADMFRTGTEARTA
jgi:hypothetical protein